MKIRSCNKNLFKKKPLTVNWIFKNLFRLIWTERTVHSSLSAISENYNFFDTDFVNAFEGNSSTYIIFITYLLLLSKLRSYCLWVHSRMMILYTVEHHKNIYIIEVSVQHIHIFMNLNQKDIKYFSYALFPKNLHWSLKALFQIEILRV